MTFLVCVHPGGSPCEVDLGELMPERASPFWNGQVRIFSCTSGGGWSVNCAHAEKTYGRRPWLIVVLEREKIKRFGEPGILLVPGQLFRALQLR